VDPAPSLALTGIEYQFRSRSSKAWKEEKQYKWFCCLDFSAVT